jgi:hypothetical protein
MKKKLAVPFVLLGFSLTTYAQPGDKKTDTVKPAKEIISKNSGEKKLPQQLKESQLNERPVKLTSDSLSTIAKDRANCRKHSKKKHI